MLRVITWGVIVALITAMTANIAGAQPGKGKALGHKTAANSAGGASQDEGVKLDKVDVCHVPPGNPENAHVISISEKAWEAHDAHHEEDSLINEENLNPGEPCEPEDLPVCEGGELAPGAQVKVDDTGTTTGEVDEGDVLTISGNFEQPASGASITITDPVTGDEFTFNDTNSDIALDPNTGDLTIVVGTTDPDPTGLPITGLVVESSEGICTVPASGAVTGEVAEAKDGSTVLKTSSGDVLKLEPAKNDSKQAKQRLKSLKGQQVKVEGKLQSDKGDKGKTLKATSVVKASGKANGKAKGKK